MHHLKPPNSPSHTQFVDFLDGCQRALLAFLENLVHNNELARDLMQDSFCEAWRVYQKGMPPFDSEQIDADRRRWLFHIAYNRAISALRHLKLIQWESLDADMQVTDIIESPLLFEEQLIESEAIRNALILLTPTERACILLIVVHGFSLNEVSQIMGASPAAIAKRYARAKQRFRMIYLAQNSALLERMNS